MVEVSSLYHLLVNDYAMKSYLMYMLQISSWYLIQTSVIRIGQRVSYEYQRDVESLFMISQK